MLLMILFFAAGGILLWCGFAIRSRDEWAAYEAAIVVGVILLIVAIAMGVQGWSDCVHRDVNTEIKLMEYQVIVTQIDGGYYDRLGYDGRKTLIDDVLTYNKAVMRGRALHRSLWVGIFYQEDFDSLPLVEFGSFQPDT